MNTDPKKSELNPHDPWGGAGYLRGFDPDADWKVWHKLRDDGTAELLAQHSGWDPDTWEYHEENRQLWAHIVVNQDWTNPGWKNAWTEPAEGPAMLAEGGWEVWLDQTCENLTLWAYGTDEDLIRGSHLAVAPPIKPSNQQRNV